MDHGNTLPETDSYAYYGSNTGGSPFIDINEPTPTTTAPMMLAQTPELP